MYEVGDHKIKMRLEDAEKICNAKVALSRNRIKELQGELSKSLDLLSLMRGDMGETARSGPTIALTLTETWPRLKVAQP